MTRRDAFLLIVSALIIAGLALYGARYREDAVDGAWRESVEVDYV